MPQEMEKYRCSASSLRIRAAPTTSSAVLGKLLKGDVIEKAGESEDGKWIKFTSNGAERWVSKKYLSKVPYIPGTGENFPWMEVAEKEKGVTEIPGAESNPRIVEYLRSTSNLDVLSTSKDETHWCSAFVNWCLKQTGYERTKSALARSWLNWGEAIDTPRRGCIVVLSRAGGFGHVGFYLDETETTIRLLGGNQQNPETGRDEVSEKSFPKSSLLGYRIPK